MKKSGLFCLLIILLFVCGCGKAGTIGENSEKLIEIKDKDFIMSSGNFIYYKDKGKDFYGYMKGGELIELIPVKAAQEITFRGITGSFEITYCTYGEESWIVNQENLPFMVGEAEYDFFVREIEGNMLKLEIARNAQQNEWGYPFYYNLLTGEITDYLEGVVIQGTSLAEMPQLSIGRTTPEGELYVSSNKKIFKINLETRESVFAGLKQKDGEEKHSAFIRLAGDEAVLIKEDGKLYCKNHKTDKKWEIDGWKEDTCILGNQIEEKLLLLGEHTYGILNLAEESYREIIIEKEDTSRICELCEDSSFTVLVGRGNSYTLTKYKSE